MSKMIFVNLPVSNLAASMAFYQATGACMVWSDAINVMLLTHGKWRTFTSRPMPPAGTSEVMLAVSCESRGMVDSMNKMAAANGGTADINPAQDWGLCITAIWRIRTATFGKRFGWMRPPCRLLEYVAAPQKHTG